MRCLLLVVGILLLFDWQVRLPGAETAPPATQPTTTQRADLAPVPFKFPKPPFMSYQPSPEEIALHRQCEMPIRLPRLLGPAGATNLALNRPVTSSDREPVIGTLQYLTDGKKEPEEEAVLQLNEGLQWVQIDLGRPCEIWGILLWHLTDPRHLRAVTKAVVVRVADDEKFTQNVRTLFNNDADNISGLGKGTDRLYVDSYMGKLIEGGGTTARYVRLYGKGTFEEGWGNPYIEAEVWGIPAR